MVLPVVVAVKLTVELAEVKVPLVASQDPDTEMVWVEVAVKVPLMSTSVKETAPPAPPPEEAGLKAATVKLHCSPSSKPLVQVIELEPLVVAFL